MSYIAPPVALVAAGARRLATHLIRIAVVVIRAEARDGGTEVVLHAHRGACVVIRAEGVVVISSCATLAVLRLADTRGALRWGTSRRGGRRGGRGSGL